MTPKETIKQATRLDTIIAKHVERVRHQIQELEKAVRAGLASSECMLAPSEIESVTRQLDMLQAKPEAALSPDTIQLERQLETLDTDLAIVVTAAGVLGSFLLAEDGPRLANAGIGGAAAGAGGSGVIPRGAKRSASARPLGSA